jgi:hypothetical protein
VDENATDSAHFLWTGGSDGYGTHPRVDEPARGRRRPRSADADRSGTMER